MLSGPAMRPSRAGITYLAAGVAGSDVETELDDVEAYRVSRY